MHIYANFLFLKVYATIERTMQEENENVDRIIDNIVMLAQQLQDNVKI